MKKQLKELNITKPKIGQACNGCGICCKIQVCKNGAFILNLVEKLGDTVPGPCPALTVNNGMYQCGIILNPNKYIKHKNYPAKVLAKHFAAVIGAGDGCDDVGYDPTEKELLEQDAFVAQMYEQMDKTALLKSMSIVHNKDF